jgi:hypothetical protein
LKARGYRFVTIQQYMREVAKPQREVQVGK